MITLPKSWFSDHLNITMKTSLVINVGLVLAFAGASVGFTFDEDCFDGFVQNFTARPEVVADRAPVVIKQYKLKGSGTQSQQDLLSQRTEILNRDQRYVFGYNTGGVYSLRNLTLMFNGEMVIGAMRKYQDDYSSFSGYNRKWLECQTGAHSYLTLEYYTVNELLHSLITLKYKWEVGIHTYIHTYLYSMYSYTHEYTYRYLGIYVHPYTHI